MIKKALGGKILESRKFQTYPLEGKWKGLGSDGHVEQFGTWIIWGQSGNGKTAFSLQLAEYLARFSPTLYDSMEEGKSMSITKATIREGANLRKNFKLAGDNTLEELNERLASRKAPKNVFIDSYQYLGMNKREYIAFKNAHRNKLLLFVSHAEGQQPLGQPAKFVRYDAMVKIYVQGFVAFPISRFGFTEPIIVNQELARKFHGDIIPDPLQFHKK